MIFGHELVAMQRDSTPQAGRPRARVGPRQVPVGTFVREVAELDQPARQRESAIEVGDARGDVRVGAVPHDAVLLVQVEAQHDEELHERARLRRAFDQAPLDAAGDGILGAEVVLRLVAQERADVARGGKADARDDRVVDLVEELVQLGRVEAVAQADRASCPACPGTAPCCSRRTPSLPARPASRRSARPSSSPTRSC